MVRLLSVIQMLAKHDVVAAGLHLLRSILYDKQAFINTLVISASKIHTSHVSQYTHICIIATVFAKIHFSNICVAPVWQLSVI